MNLITWSYNVNQPLVWPNKELGLPCSIEATLITSWIHVNTVTSLPPILHYIIIMIIFVACISSKIPSWIHVITVNSLPPPPLLFLPPSPLTLCIPLFTDCVTGSLSHSSLFTVLVDDDVIISLQLHTNQQTTNTSKT